MNYESQQSLTELCSKDGRKKIEDMYHVSTERSEFYTMSDVLKPPVLFTPSEELEKVCCELSWKSHLTGCNLQQMNAGEINFFAGQSGSEMSATGFESGANSLPAIVSPPSPLSVVSGSVILLHCIFNC